MTKRQNRQSLYTGFLQSYFKNEDFQCIAITSDASFRCYHRVSCREQNYILMDSDPSKLDNQPFIALNANFLNNGIKVPKILHADTEQGLILLEDLGKEHLADRVHLSSRYTDYCEILALLPNIATTLESPFMKAYDAEFISLEIDIFWQWLVCEWLALTRDELPSKAFQASKSYLVNAILAQPQVTMHRDFHSRNIMHTNTGWALIDYQDAVQGPVTYDAVSLLRDCYLKLPKEEFNTLRLKSFEILGDAQLLSGMSFEQYCYYFDMTGMQRHLKAAGIFCRLLLRDEKAGYLKDIIPTLKYIEDVAKCYESFQWLATWLRHEIIPKVEVKLSCNT
ncbi:N-acetylmuramate/N-acetylglucosamine kinase [Pseudoalteromonas holothuriae]|uniref:N-acetylmuramate/N-acetylglucosamine kinase n=1 Tax=Pseudoalteromonas holothuriae TaxID=2963714 RepID=A0ABM9GL13_9GAMM|nr:phosphotransferase [Pseudoalteromonas sp. CIP111951]CAH9064300.1 N-acetylmuramate/N-acetylglucosamine kinase [Pseudoalteromonas sp. CIP111951]